MDKIAFVFPGQGTQYVGMGKDLAMKYKIANEVFEEANDIMKMDIKGMCFEGTEEELVKTENQQPAIHTVEIAVLRVLESYGINPYVTAGFSLGEYAALVCAGALKYEDTVKLVKKRGLIMQNAVPFGEGKMIAIVGLKQEEIQEIIEESKAQGVIEFSNFNCPGEIIVSGHALAIEKAANIAIERGAKKVNFLNVSGPFHTSLLKSAGKRLRQELDHINIYNLNKKFITNVHGSYVKEDEDIKELLKKHVYKPVLWEKSVDTMLEDGVNIFIEIGPKNTISKFIKRIADKHNKNIYSYNVEDSNTLKACLEGIKNI